jgi:hypothetical protein
MEQDKTQTFDEFTKEMSENVEKFKKFWKKNQLICRDNSFPNEMFAGDWWEQFCIFCEGT